MNSSSAYLLCACKQSLLNFMFFSLHTLKLIEVFKVKLPFHDEARYVVVIFYHGITKKLHTLCDTCYNSESCLLLVICMLTRTTSVFKTSYSENLFDHLNMFQVTVIVYIRLKSWVHIQFTTRWWMIMKTEIFGLRFEEVYWSICNCMKEVKSSFFVEP